MFTDRINAIQPSPTLAVSAKAAALKAQGKAIISLSAGEPDFDTPLPIKQAAIAAIEEGQTKYTAVEGTLALRKAVCHKLERDNQLHYTPEQILISVGAKHSIFNALLVLIQAEDEVIIPAPYWVSYPDMVLMMGGKPVFINSLATNHFKISPEQLEAAITPRTKMLILNSPSNPTGAAYTRNELEALSKILLKHPQVIILSDEIYEHIAWHHEPCVNLVMVAPELSTRSLIVNGVSKAYAMTGWRIGFAAGPVPIIKAMAKAQSQSTSNPCSIAQAAATAAFLMPLDEIAPMVQAFKERHNYFIAALNTIPGFACQATQGAFYALVNVQEAITKLGLKNDLAFADYLLEKAEVAGVPGSAFGAEGYIRFSFATSMENLKTAIARLAALFA